MKTGNREGRFPIRAGLVAGSLAAVVAVLVNLPLHSPSDAFLNSATVMVGSLAAGFGAGCLWSILRLVRAGEVRRRMIFGACLALAFGLVCVIAVVAETQLQRSVSYFVPLAAVVVGITGTFTWLLLRNPRFLQWKLAVLAVLIAVGLGIGLAGQGDQESGKLELPPRASLAGAGGGFPAPIRVGVDGHHETREHY